ncbi:hypothetical protein [Marinobacter caseinilyticus]|uniref:hypothetical protein n=1 Tax=Marinobacter caseinilyticus TaxID=2692195 RepID=UPI00140C4CE1|nr:hypothetical protein [Marinobacter caseinilyticus]
MPHVKYLDRTAIIGLTFLVSACAGPGMVGQDAVTGSVRPSEVRPNAAKPPPEPQPEALCAWSQIRGIATLLAMDPTRQPPQGTWQFFPGDDVVFVPVPDQAQPGDEYKALLRRPLSGGCQTPVLILVAPV